MRSEENVAFALTAHTVKQVAWKAISCFQFVRAIGMDLEKKKRKKT